MKISEIDLWNFRQFYGRETLKLACGDEQNVTLIHAENGVGKTTLLNAVYWAMFGEVTPRFEQRDRIVNFEAEHEGEQHAKVEIEFAFNGQQFRASRRFEKNAREPIFGVSKVEHGALVPLPAPETFINSVIPKDMAKYFFFDGEHAESFAAEQNQGTGAAIRSMLGCDLAERGISDLKAVGAQYTRLVSDVEGEAGVQSLRDRLSRLEDEQEADEAALKDHEKSIEEAATQKALIEEALRRTSGAKEIQLLRDELEAQKTDAEFQIGAARAELVHWIGDKAIAVTSRKLTSKTLDFIDEESVRGRLPSPYREDFIQGLLEKETCICCRDLKPTSENWAAVAALLQTAGNTEVLNLVVRARTRLISLKENAANAPKLLGVIQERLASLLDRYRTLEQRVGEESRKLEDFNLDEVRKREMARVTLDKMIRDRSAEVGSLRSAIKVRAQSINALEVEIQTKVAKNEKARTIMQKRKLAFSTAERLKTLLQLYEEEARKEIEAEINHILQRTARRDYRFEFADDFKMSLLHADVDGAVPKSGGENQLMSLAFTAALIRFSKARLNKKHFILSPGTVAPLVLDAPIGHLDRSYRHATAEFIPKMAGQVILLLSSAHTSDSVLEALRPHVGMEYVLISENKGPRDNKGDDAIDLHGKTYVRSLFNQDRNRTRIQRVI